MKLILNRPTPQSIVEWYQRIENKEAGEIYAMLKDLKPFTKDEKSQDLNDLVAFLEAFYDFVLKSENERSKIKTLCHDIFKFSDLCYLSIKGIEPKITKKLSESAKWNLFWFLRFIPLPNKRLYPLFRDDYEMIPIGSEALSSLVEILWLNFTKLEIPTKLCRLLVLYFVESVIDVLPNSELFGDFLFGVFNKGHVYSILSLAGIFKLMINRNFEYPEFYPQVYRLTHGSICYSAYSQKFFELLDLFLSSTHIPAYILASFVKKLSRILLNAPLNHQLVLLTLIRNLITRHNVLLPLVHRDEPARLSTDPYIEEEPNLKNSKALESSLWEITLIKKHWYDRVFKKADFLDKQAQEQENWLQWRTIDDLFEEMMSRKYSTGILKFRDEQDEQGEQSDEDEKPKKKKKVTFVELGSETVHNLKHDVLPMNYITPTDAFIRTQADESKLWAL